MYIVWCFDFVSKKFDNEVYKTTIYCSYSTNGEKINATLSKILPYYTADLKHSLGAPFCH